LLLLRRYCVPYNNMVIDNRFIDVPCVDYPILKTPSKQLRLWNFTATGNNNTTPCGGSLYY
jgi:hypothetical protein